jgi:hypothetical protein
MSAIPSLFVRHIVCSFIASALLNLSPENLFTAPVPKLAGLMVVSRPNLRRLFSPAFSFLQSSFTSMSTAFQVAEEPFALLPGVS